MSLKDYILKTENKTLNVFGHITSSALALYSLYDFSKGEYFFGLLKLALSGTIESDIFFRKKRKNTMQNICSLEKLAKRADELRLRLSNQFDDLIAKIDNTMIKPSYLDIGQIAQPFNYFGKEYKAKSHSRDIEDIISLSIEYTN